MQLTQADGVLERTEEGKDRIRFERRLDHPIEKVWAALTEPGEMSAWWGEAEVELRVGGRFVLSWQNPGGPTMHATITELDPPRLLETDGDVHGTLRWQLEPDGDGTRLTFTSTLDLPDEYRTQVLAGWHFHLDALAEHLRGGEPEIVDLEEEFEQIHRQYTARPG
jgi:uncharacterized protein YndB with AHSA1/START domain